MAKIIIPDKICPHCGGTEWYIRPKGGLDCVLQRKEYRHNWGLLNKNKEKLSKDIWNTKNKTARRQTSTIRSKNDTANLSDAYIKRVIRQRDGRKFKDISADEVIARRNQILEKREFNKLPDKIKSEIYKQRSTIAIKNWKERNSKELNDKFIKMHYAGSLSRMDIPTKVSEVTPEEIVKIRAHLMKVRTLKKINQMQTQIRVERPDIFPVIDTSLNKEVEKFNRSKTKRLLKLEELHSYLDPTVTLSISTNVRDNKRWALRKELGVRTIEEVEEAINSLKQELANEFSSKIDSSTTITELAKTALVGDERETVAKSSDDNDVVAEFKKLEERRQEILQYVEAFNNYVESFKINLS